MLSGWPCGGGGCVCDKNGVHSSTNLENKPAGRAQVHGSVARAVAPPRTQLRSGPKTCQPSGVVPTRSLRKEQPTTSTTTSARQGCWCYPWRSTGAQLYIKTDYTVATTCTGAAAPDGQYSELSFPLPPHGNAVVQPTPAQHDTRVTRTSNQAVLTQPPQHEVRPLPLHLPPTDRSAHLPQ